MAHYYFDVINGIGLVVDEEGQDLPDLDHARETAIAGVRSILCEDLVAGFVDLSGRIEVKDGERRTLLTLAFAEAVEVRGLCADGRTAS
jgi:hypothetical protein